MKTERFTFRLSPRYRRYLEIIAERRGVAVGGLLNRWISVRFRDFIQDETHYMASREVLRSHGIDLEGEPVNRYWEEVVMRTLPEKLKLQYIEESMAAGHRIFGDLVKQYDFEEDEAQAGRKRARRSAAR